MTLTEKTSFHKLVLKIQTHLHPIKITRKMIVLMEVL